MKNGRADPGDWKTGAGRFFLRHPLLQQVRASELAGRGAGQSMQDALPTGNSPSEYPHTLKSAYFRVSLQIDIPFQEILKSNGLKRLHMA